MDSSFQEGLNSSRGFRRFVVWDHRLNSIKFALTLILLVAVSPALVVANERDLGEAGPSASSGEAPSIRKGSDSFEFVYRVGIPALQERASLWLPFASSDAFQEVTLIGIEGPIEWRELSDRDFGNRILYFELGPESSGSEIVVRYRVTRREKSSYKAREPEMAKYLRAERLTPLLHEFKQIAEKTIEGKSGQREMALALYNHVLDLLRYDKSGVGWGRGDALYACDVKSGNCTDFHAYFIALSRSVGIPARFAIGATIPANKSEGFVAGYHCWAEVYADGSWLPIDISEAWKHPAMAQYYFGNHPANRIELSQGRDLVVDPLPPSGPINFLVYPILAVQGREEILVPDLFFKRI